VRSFGLLKWAHAMSEKRSAASTRRHVGCGRSHLDRASGRRCDRGFAFLLSGALARLGVLVAVAGVLATAAVEPGRAAAPPQVALNEINCTGTDWIELTNHGDMEVSVGNWLLTDDALDRDPLRDTHRWRLPQDVVLAPGAQFVVSQGAGGFAFGLSCGDDTLRLADADDTLVDSFTLPVLATGGMTYGRVPDGTGDWTVALPTPGAANVVATGGSEEDPAWLYDPLQVTEIDLEASEASLSALRANPGEYVEARITLRNSASTHGPYLVGLRLKGHTAFRSLDRKAAFKVKFGFAVSGQRFHGLKGLTLNNMVQDPSMIGEATTSLLAAAAGVPAARVGYAYVRLNGAEYGLYANVENIDAVMARRWFAGTQHVYEGGYGVDAIPGRTGEFEVDEGSSSDLSDLETLAAANAGGADAWWARVQPVADLVEMTRAWAVEHYAGHWDGYSVGAGPTQPNNYYLHSDPAGRFAFIVTGTDQTWLDRTEFGVYGKGVLMRGCVADETCRGLYVDALGQMASTAAIVALPAQIRAIRATIAPWRARDPRREQSVAVGEAQADEKIATLDARPSELAAWLARPFFLAAAPQPEAEVGGGGSGGAPNDLNVTGTVTPTSSPVGGSHVWRVVVQNAGGGEAVDVALDVQLSPNLAYGFGQATRGSGCAPSGTVLRCLLGSLGPFGSDSSVAEVVFGSNVTGFGEVSLTATASFSEPDPTPSDNTIVLRANTPAPVSLPDLPTSTVMRPILGTPVGSPAKPVAGRRFTFVLPVTRSDTRAPLSTGKMDCDPSVSGRTLVHTDSFKAGKARLSFVVPRSARGKLLKVRIAITAAGRTARHTYTYPVR
jgi:CotH protein/lamin tail-like protein/uncharacterized protein DUF11